MERTLYHGHGRVLRPEVEHGRERPEGSKRLCPPTGQKVTKSQDKPEKDVTFMVSSKVFGP